VPAGAYAENLPVICITGGPNSNDFASNRLIHHTLGKKFDFLQEMEAFKQVTCEQVGACHATRGLDTSQKQLASWPLRPP
jgi:TPP-dependent 2-oxoacid decarboxylase